MINGSKPGHILVLDDEVAVAATLARLLQHSGYDVATANDCEMALELLHKQVPDLILSDVNMPCQNGLEFLQNLRAVPRTKHVPVVLVSARTRPEDKEAGLAAGAKAYLFKPFDPAELLTVVKDVLDERERGRERKLEKAPA